MEELKEFYREVGMKVSSHGGTLMKACITYDYLDEQNDLNSSKPIIRVWVYALFSCII